MASQRLAVGTSEGAIVMYDLKTATRLYVLESHKQALAACSFSPDGRRLVTMSLQEGTVLVWKVGTGFTSFFYPGAPPRQGHGGSEPFKTLNFNVGEAGEFPPSPPQLLLSRVFFKTNINQPSVYIAVMSLEETFEHVHFEWTAERSVQLKIRDVRLTFST
jgi:WD40 repeat protein